MFDITRLETKDGRLILTSRFTRNRPKWLNRHVYTLVQGGETVLHDQENQFGALDRVHTYCLDTFETPGTRHG